MGGEPLPLESPFVPEPRTQEVLLGCFGESPARPTHVLTVNLDYCKACTTTLAGPGPMELFHPPTRTWKELSGDTRIKLELPPGGGALVRVRK